MMSPTRHQVAVRRTIKISLLLIAIVAVIVFFQLHLDRALSMASLKEHQFAFRAYYQEHHGRTIALFSLGIIVMIVCAIPAATPVILLAGAVFGVVVGTAICAVSFSVGGVLSLLSARFLFRDFIARRFRRQAALVESEYRKRGSSYLIAMRLIPALPYSLTNVIFALTSISVRRFWVVSLLASLPGFIIYTNAGSELSKINEFSDIFTWRLIAAFAALAALPWLGKLFVKTALHRSPKTIESRIASKTDSTPTDVEPF